MPEKITFNEYLHLDNSESKEIFNYYTEFLEEMLSKGYPSDDLLKIQGAAGKFINCVRSVSYQDSKDLESYIAHAKDLTQELRYFTRIYEGSFLKRLFGAVTKRGRLNKVNESFDDLYTRTIDFINDISYSKKYYDRIDLNGFYQPENSNKQKVKELIDEAIELISQDESLSEKSKKEIINYLKKAIRELDSEHVNWNRFIGRIKETIIILGALGSLAGGLSPLITAKDKLEESTTIIQNTSININHNVLNDTSNVNSMQKIGNINTESLQINAKN